MVFKRSVILLCFMAYNDEKLERCTLPHFFLHDSTKQVVLWHTYLIKVSNTCSYKIHFGVKLKNQVYSCDTLFRRMYVNKRYSVRTLTIIVLKTNCASVCRFFTWQRVYAQCVFVCFKKKLYQFLLSRTDTRVISFSRKNVLLIWKKSHSSYWNNIKNKYYYLLIWKRAHQLVWYKF